MLQTFFKQQTLQLVTTGYLLGVYMRWAIVVQRMLAAALGAARQGSCHILV